MATGPDGPGLGDLGDLGIRWGVETGIKVLGNVLGGGPKGPTAADRAALEAAGYRYGAYRGPGNVVEPPKNGKFVPVWINDATGDLIGNKRARGYARSNPPSAAGPTIPDRAGLPSIPGIPTAIPLPNIPGLPSSIPIPAIPPAALPVILGPLIAGGLFYPQTAGRGSDLRDLYGMPTPKKGNTRKPGRRARGRKRNRIPNPWGPPRTRTGVKPQATSGRGGPVTISRPNARQLPQPVAIPAKLPKPGVLRPPGAGVKINTGPIKASPPAKIPQTRAQQAAAAARGVLGLPIIGDLIKGAIGASLSSLFVKSPQLGRITLPNIGPQPLPMPSPLTALNPLALTYARPMPATAASTQEQDCSCRPVRKKSTKKRCKNPVTSRRSFKRGSRKFVTTTKELKCRA